MNYKTSITYLLSHAGPSIRLRTRRDILGEKVSRHEEDKLISAILEEPKMKQLLANQHPNGWFFNHLHGVDSHEAAIRYLNEKGLTTRHAPLKTAVAALRKERNSRRISLANVGIQLDKHRLGGSKMILAATWAYAGAHSALVRQQIRIALEAFKFVSKVKRMDDILDTFKGTPVIRNNTHWPSFYHFQLLGHTYKWRTAENLKMVLAGVKKMASFSPIPAFKLKYKTQLIAPATPGMYDFISPYVNARPFDSLMWFQRLEMIARLGIADKVPAINKHLVFLKRTLAKNDGICALDIKSSAFRTWSAYGGISLEPAWTKPEQRHCDLTFRVLRSLKLSGMF